jgi:hypothetical protein
MNNKCNLIKEAKSLVKIFDFCSYHCIDLKEVNFLQNLVFELLAEIYALEHAHPSKEKKAFTQLFRTVARANEKLDILTS